MYTNQDDRLPQHRILSTSKRECERDNVTTYLRLNSSFPGEPGAAGSLQLLQKRYFGMSDKGFHRPHAFPDTQSTVSQH